MTRGIVLLTMALSGCATSPRVYRYDSLGFSVIKADPDTVNRVCADRIKVNDSGLPVTGRIRCCYLGADGIWVSHAEIDCILHELCHADGRSKEECKGIY